MKNKITLIVPIYKVFDKKLDVFIDSIKDQTNNRFNVIFIDDGNSKEDLIYLKKQASKIIDIKIITIQHSGVSFARNVGINNVETEYVAFSDADDILDKHFIETAYLYIDKYRPDIIYGTIQYVPELDSRLQSGDNPILFSGKKGIREVKKKILDIDQKKGDFIILGSQCGRVYKTDLAKDTLFINEVRLYEDQLFNRQIIEKANKVLVVPNVWYYYLLHDGSSLNNAFSRNYYNEMKTYIEISKQMDLSEDEEIYNGMLFNYIKLLYLLIINDYVKKPHNKSLSQINNELKDIGESELFKEAISKCRFNLANIRLIDKINIVLFRSNQYWLVYLEKKWNYERKQHR